jgi:flavodoxin
MSTTGCPKTLLVYKSVHHQNTARIAHEIAGVLGADCAAPAECSYSRLSGCELLGIGSGVYYGRPHDELLQWVRGLPDGYARDLPVFIFTTSGLPVLAKLWHRPLKAALAEKGYDVIAEFACRGFDTWGPLWLTGGLNRAHPDERDLQRAREFAERVGSWLNQGAKAGTSVSDI